MCSTSAEVRQHRGSDCARAAARGTDRRSAFTRRARTTVRVADDVHRLRTRYLVLVLVRRRPGIRSCGFRPQRGACGRLSIGVFLSGSMVSQWRRGKDVGFAVVRDAFYMTVSPTARIRDGRAAATPSRHFSCPKPVSVINVTRVSPCAGFETIPGACRSATRAS